MTEQLDEEWDDVMSLNDEQVRLKLVCEQFLYREARLLDRNQYNDWFELIHEDILYKVPVLTRREKTAGLGYSDSNYHFNDDFGSLKTRIERLNTDYAWAENPPSRTKRFVTNVHILNYDSPESITVSNNLYLHFGHDDPSQDDSITAERKDRLVCNSGGWKLAERNVYLNQATLPRSLSIFL